MIIQTIQIIIFIIKNEYMNIYSDFKRIKTMK